VIGTAFIPLLRTAGGIGEKCEVTVDLLPPVPKDKGAGKGTGTGTGTNNTAVSAGKVSVMMQLKRAAVEVQELDLGLPADFTVGVISIKMLECRGLPNTEIGMDPPDPYARVSFGDWEDATPTLQNFGVDPLWKDLQMHFEVNRDSLLKEKLKIVVMDENSLTSDALMGMCTFNALSLKKLCASLDTGIEVDLKGKMSAESGAAAGTCFLKATLKKTKLSALETADALPESTVTIPSAGGILSISAIDAYDVISKEFLGKKVSSLLDAFIMLPSRGSDSNLFITT
jgi:C2 domain